MSRRTMAAAMSVVLAAVMLPSVRAQDQGYRNPAAGGYVPGAVAPQAGRMNRDGGTMPMAYRAQEPMGGFIPPTPIDPAPATPGIPEAAPGYVRLNAPLYPCPQPNTPIWVGSTVITNQALAPHEMLYPHTYRAIYPPYYHRVKGGWLLTPLGVRSHEKWELQGTMVQVKYRSNYPSLLSGHTWHPPATSYMHGAWR